MRTDGGTTIYINANVNGNAYSSGSAKIEVANGITINGILYSGLGIIMGENVTVNGTVCCNAGEIEMKKESRVTGDVITGLSSGTNNNFITGTDCRIDGTVYVRGSITTGAGTTIGDNAKSTTSTVTLNGDVGGSVYGLIVTTGLGAVISGDVTATSTLAPSILRGSVLGNVYTDAPLKILEGSGQIGSTTANTLRCKGKLEVSSSYSIKGSVNNTIGDMTIGEEASPLTSVGGSVECPNGICKVYGSIGGNLRSTNETTVKGSIAGNVYVYNSSLNPDVKFYGNVGGAGTTTSIKGNLYQYATISGTLIVQGSYIPDTSIITSFPSLSISGDMTLNFPSGGSLGDPGSATNITGVLTIISGGTVNVYGKIICGYLRVNKDNSTSDIYTRNTMISSFGEGNPSSVVFYDEVHVQNNAYVLGATFNKYVDANNPGSTLFVGNHLATRDSVYYATGYVSSTNIANSLSYGSFSVGYVTGSGSVVTQGIAVHSRTQVKGDAYYYHSYFLGTGATVDSYQKVSHFISGNLTLEGSRMYAQGAQNPSYDTLIIVGGNCYLRYYSTDWPTYIGHPDALLRKGYKDTYEGLFVNGILSIEKDTAVYVDTYATYLSNSGLIQIGAHGNGVIIKSIY